VKLIKRLVQQEEGSGIDKKEGEIDKKIGESIKRSVKLIKRLVQHLILSEKRNK